MLLESTNFSKTNQSSESSNSHFQMDSLCVIFAPALEKYTISLLARIAVDYNIPNDELVVKYLTRPEAIKAKVTKPRAPKDPNAPPKPPKIPTEDRPICPSLTAKKTPCKYRCVPGSDKCHLHSVILPTGEPKPPKAKKVKEQPAHSHVPLVAPEAPCQLCDSHGDATNPSLTNLQFESKQDGMTLQERLRMIIQMGEEAEPEPEPDNEVESSRGDEGDFDNEMTEDEGEGNGFMEEELLD